MTSGHGTSEAGAGDSAKIDLDSVVEWMAGVAIVGSEFVESGRLGSTMVGTGFGAFCGAFVSIRAYMIRPGSPTSKLPPWFCHRMCN